MVSSPFHLLSLSFSRFQTLYYSRKYKKDPLVMRAIVWTLLIANIVQAGSQLARDIVILALGFGDWKRLGDFHSRLSSFRSPRLYASLELSFEQRSCSPTLLDSLFFLQEARISYYRSCELVIYLPSSNSSLEALGVLLNLSFFKLALTSFALFFPLLSLFSPPFFPRSRSTSSVLIISSSQSIIATRSYLFCRSLAAGHLSKLDIASALARAVLILASLSFGIGAIVSEFQYANLFVLGAVNSVRDIGKSV